MRTLLLLFCLLFTCLGCSLPLTKDISSHSSTPGLDQSLLWKIQFHRWSKPVFTGLLGLRLQKNSLHYVLMDGSGITLIQAQVSHDGNISGQKGVNHITKSELPEYLAESLQKIYFLEPKAQQCSTTFFFKLCRKKGKNMIVKHLSLGPFTLHRTEYKINREGKQTMILFSQPWYGIRITLKSLD